jgi:glutamine synthetase
MRKTFVEYIWIDGTSPTPLLRSKTKVLPRIETLGDRLSHLPEWIFDGSSTNQAMGMTSDLLLRPVRCVPDPLRGEGHFLALCEVFKPDGETPHESNYRAKTRAVLDAGAENSDSWFGFEQEYTFFKKGRPYGFPESGYPAPQGPYYCGVGAAEVHGREIVEKHLLACIDAGLHITGINAEVMPGQWEFQVGGPDSGPLVSSDHLWLARWLLYRIGEDYGVDATLDPKPARGDWNGAGMHTNFSTAAMRSDKPLDPGSVAGMAAIEAACEALRTKRSEHLGVYGHGYENRLTGAHETASWKEFRYGVGDRTASIRIPIHVAKAGCGYLEDRRPNSNADPYRVCEVMLKTVCGLW